MAEREVWVVRVTEKVHQIGSLMTGYEYRAGGTCDVCGQCIRYAYTVQASNGVQFDTGCDCAQKCGMSAAELKEAKRAFNRERRDAEREASIRQSLAEQRARNGGLTDKELRECNALGRDAARRWLEAERKAEAVHVGSPKQRLRGLELRVDHVACWDGYYGPTNLFIMRDRAGNAYTWKTSSLLGMDTDDGWRSVTQKMEFGRKSCWFICDATIKDHTEYDGLKQTVLTRPKVKSMGELKELGPTRYLRAD